MPLSFEGFRAFADRPLALRMRPELVAQQLRFEDRRAWRIKDPVSLEYFELADEEYAILRMLDGRTSLGEIKRRFEQLFAPLRLTLGQLQGYVAHLHQEGLILAEVAGQGTQLLKRLRAGERHEFAATLLSLMAIRFRGIDPDRFLNVAYRWLSFLFSPRSLAVGTCLALGAFLLVMLKFDTFMTKLERVGDYFTPANFLWMGIALALAKFLHECVHALTLKHLGGQCHEMGVLLLAFVPCLYCDVSDAWLIPGKWGRIAVSAAGVLVEILLSSVCVFLWWNSEPGFFNSLCLNIVLVCSVSTLLFNANPLLRYDGYYILSDLLEEPNLGDRASQVLSDLARRHCLGLEIPQDARLTSSRAFVLAIYAVLAAGYRCFVLVAILWFCYTMLREWGMTPAAHVLIVAAVVGAAIQPVRAATHLLKSPLMRRQIRRRPAAITFLVAVAILAGLWFIPFPQTIRAQVVVQSQGGHQVYVPVAGTMLQTVRAGTVVRKGEVIGKLGNLELDREIAELAGQENRLAIHIRSLESRRGIDPEATSEIPAAREHLADVRQRLIVRQRDAQRLELTAPAAGIVLPPPKTLPAAPIEGLLNRWEGTPLDSQNLGCWLETGTLFCVIGDPQEVEPILIINQNDVDLVKPGQKVRMALEQFPGVIRTGSVEEIAATNLRIVPRELTSQIAVRTDGSDVPRPAETLYQARVTLDPQSAQPLLRTNGRAKVIVAPLPLGAWFLRTLRQIFHFRA